MIRSRCMAQVIVGILLSSAGLADDAKPPNNEAEPLEPESLAVEKLLAESAYGSRWQLTRPVGQAPAAGEWRHPVAEIESRDAVSPGHVTRPRTLSSLTLPRSNQARLFFGINEDGVLGLHFRAASQRSAERYLEPGRMSHISQSGTDPETDRGME